MEIQSGNVVEEAISKKETSVAELTKKLLEVDTSLRQCLSCQPAVQPSLSAFQCVEDPERRFRLLAGLEFLLGECLREVQSILSKARGEERKKRIADGFAEALKHLLHHQDVLERSCWNELVKPSGESNHADKKRYGGAIGRQVSRCEKHIERVQKDWEKIRELKEEREALERGEHLSEEERASLVSAYDAAIAETRLRIELLLKEDESDDAVIQEARKAADDAVSDVRKRSERLLRLDQSSPPAAPKEHQKGSRGQRAAHEKRRDGRPIETNTRFVSEEGGGEKKSTDSLRIYALSSLPGDGTTFMTTEFVGMDMPPQSMGGEADAFPVFEFSIAEGATEADAEAALETAREMVGRCCDALNKKFNYRSRMLSQREGISKDEADERLREQFSPDAEQACGEALRLRFRLSPGLEREKVIVYLCNAATTVVRAVDREATMTMGKRVKLTAMASSLHMQAELVEDFAFSPFVEIIADIRDAIHGGTARADDVGQAVMEAMWPPPENGASSPQAEIREVLPSDVAKLVQQLMEKLNEQGYVTAHNIVAAEVLLALGVQSNTICIHSASPPSS